MPTPTRGPLPPSEVDRLDIPLVAALLGVMADPLTSNDPHVMAEAMNRERVARVEVVQARAAAEGRQLTLREAEDEAAVSWDALRTQR